MLTTAAKQKIEALIPAIVQRGRMGDQNALGMLTEVGRRQKGSERAKFAYESAIRWIRKNPKTDSGIVTIAGDESELAPALYERISNIVQRHSPLTCAIIIAPIADVLVPSMISGDTSTVFRYIESLKAARMGDFSHFPQILWELGD